MGRHIPSFILPFNDSWNILMIYYTMDFFTTIEIFFTKIHFQFLVYGVHLLNSFSMISKEYWFRDSFVNDFHLNSISFFYLTNVEIYLWIRQTLFPVTNFPFTSKKDFVIFSCNRNKIFREVGHWIIIWKIRNALFSWPTLLVIIERTYHAT